MVLVQCQGTTRAGRRCTITSSSNMRDKVTGQLIAAPLRNKGTYCLFHTTIFCTTEECEPRDKCLQPPIVVYVDLETTSLDALRTEVVELGALVDDTGAAFASLACPLESSSAAAERVHGIGADELSSAPPFQTMFKRFLRFLREVASPLHRGDQRSKRIRCAIRDDPVEICLVAHNGMKFDFAVLSSQCWREGIPLQQLANFKYCDSLELLQVLNMPSDLQHSLGDMSCLKLQCLGRCFKGQQAHRALEDVRKLQQILVTVSERIDISIAQLVNQISRRMDLGSIEATLNCLIGQPQLVVNEEDSPLHSVTQLDSCSSTSSSQTSEVPVPQFQEATTEVDEVAVKDHPDSAFKDTEVFKETERIDPWHSSLQIQTGTVPTRRLLHVLKEEKNAPAPCTPPQNQATCAERLARTPVLKRMCTRIEKKNIHTNYEEREPKRPCVQPITR